MADELLNSCMLAQYPAVHENITQAQKAFANSSCKIINKTVNAIRSSCDNKVNIENVDGRIELPLPYVITNETRDVYKTANLTRQYLFSFYSYRPFAMVYFKINGPTNNYQYLQLCRNLIANSTISVDCEFHDNDIKDNNVACVDITDTYHNKLRMVVYTKDFRNTIIEHYGVKFTPATILPPEKRIRIFTKESNPMEIEKGCTALDFAFVLKTDIGVCYNGAEINGEPVEMDFVFQSGEQITIIKANDPIARLD